MSNNHNHPTKGSSIIVEPIRSIQHIIEIRKILRSTSLRDDLLFTMGINNSLRITDLLQIKVEDIRHKPMGTCLTIKEHKAGKENILVINPVVYQALQDYIRRMLHYNYSKEWVYLFQSRKGGKPLSLSSVNAKVKKWTLDVGLIGNYGAQSLRKTWGFHQKTRFGVSFNVLCKRFNHSSPAHTMRYLGILEEKTDYILASNEIGVISYR